MQASVMGETLKETDVEKNKDAQRVAKVRDHVTPEGKGEGKE